MPRPTFRQAVRELNLFLAGGISTEPEPVYGRHLRGNVEHVGNRSELSEDYPDVDPSSERVIKKLRYDLVRRRYVEEDVAPAGE